MITNCIFITNVFSSEHIFFSKFEIFFLRFKKNQNSQINLLAKSFQTHRLFFFYDNSEESNESLKKQKSCKNHKMKKCMAQKKEGNFF